MLRSKLNHNRLSRVNTCVVCTGEFQPFAHATGKYCSVQCANKAINKKYDHEVIDRILDKIDIENECWVWTGCKLKQGYGRTTYKGRNVMTHRILFRLLAGDIPKKMTLDHLCNNPPCINPDHLEIVTLRENLLRGRTGKNLEKTHCKRGHIFDEKNTYVTFSKNGYKHRSCRECARKATRAWYYKKKNKKAGEKTRKDNKSGHRGVLKPTYNRNWIVQFRGGYVGSFKSREEAIDAYHKVSKSNEVGIDCCEA